MLSTLCHEMYRPSDDNGDDDKFNELPLPNDK
jgi:hypothetical protein